MSRRLQIFLIVIALVALFGIPLVAMTGLKNAWTIWYECHTPKDQERYEDCKARVSKDHWW